MRTLWYLLRTCRQGGVVRRVCGSPDPYDGTLAAWRQGRMCRRDPGHTNRHRTGVVSWDDDGNRWVD
jgi:hypothetical protein